MPKYIRNAGKQWTPQEERIKTFNEQSSKQTDKSVGLTWWIVGLTVAMLAGLIIQIILAL